MDYSKLKTDIAARFPSLTDPAAIAAGMNDLAVASVGSVAMPTVLIWAASFGVTAKIQARAAAVGDALQSAALSFLLALQGGYPSLDMGNASVAAMIDNFVAAGDVTTTARTALLTLASAATPYVQATYGVPYVSADDIACALSRSQ